IGLQFDGLGHAAQPGIALGITYWPAAMEHRDADLSVVLLEQLGTAKPAAEKAGKLVPGKRQILGMHIANGASGLPGIHDAVEVIYQAANAFNAASSLVRGVLAAVVGWLGRHIHSYLDVAGAGEPCRTSEVWHGSTQKVRYRALSCRSADCFPGSGKPRPAHPDRNDDPPPAAYRWRQSPAPYPAAVGGYRPVRPANAAAWPAPGLSAGRLQRR